MGPLGRSSVACIHVYETTHIGQLYVYTPIHIHVQLQKSLGYSAIIDAVCYSEGKGALDRLGHHVKSILWMIHEQPKLERGSALAYAYADGKA